MRFIAIATPSYDGNVSIEYASSLANTVSLCEKNGIIVHSFFYSGEAIVQSARNKLFAGINTSIYESTVFIDSDISWNPKDIIKLIDSNKDVIGATYRKKQEQEAYVFNGNIKDDEFVSEVGSLGFGFIKLSSKAMSRLWNFSESYVDDGVSCKNIFEVIVKDGQMYSEDISVCLKLKDLGFPIHLDKTINLIHSGKVNFRGNFYEWSKSI